MTRRSATLFVLFGLLIGAAEASFAADSKNPPAGETMSQLDAARLDAALGHLRDAQRAAEEVQKAFEQAKAEVEALLRKAKIEPAEYFSRLVAVDFKTGQITRQKKPEAKPEPKPAKGAH